MHLTPPAFSHPIPRPKHMQPIWTKNYKVRAYEAGMRGHASILSVLNYLQDIASEHAAHLEVDLKDLRPFGLTWFLSRYHLKIEKYPFRKDSCELTTWPSGWYRLFAVRDFDMRDESGEQLLLGSSAWLLIDLARKRPVRPPAELKKFPLHEKRAWETDFPAIPIPENWVMEKEYEAGFFDLDVNKHVNNAVYLRWALNTIPREILESREISELEVDFRGEAFFGEVITSRTAVTITPDSCLTLHQLTRQEDGREILRVRASWNS